MTLSRFATCSPQRGHSPVFRFMVALVLGSMVQQGLVAQPEGAAGDAKTVQIPMLAGDITGHRQVCHVNSGVARFT